MFIQGGNKHSMAIQIGSSQTFIVHGFGVLYVLAFVSCSMRQAFSIVKNNIDIQDDELCYCFGL